MHREMFNNTTQLCSLGASSTNPGCANQTILTHYQMSIGGKPPCQLRIVATVETHLKTHSQTHKKILKTQWCMLIYLYSMILDILPKAKPSMS